VVVVLRDPVFPVQGQELASELRPHRDDFVGNLSL
jgi:hypothetical protein